MGQKPERKRFFDDWELSVGAASGGGAFLRITMPHNPKQNVTYITGSTNEIKHVANLIDSLLSHLTDTKVKRVIVDGPAET